MNNKGSKRKATALSYKRDNAKAPTVIAQGQGYMAEKITKVAEDNEVPIYKDERLAQQLENLSIGDEIPEELYEVVAEVLIFISKVDSKGKSK